MKNFYYALKQVFRLKTSNGIKLLSLTLGLVIGSAILCRSAFMDSFDKFLPNVENTNFLVLKWNIANKGESESLQAMGPMAQEMLDKIPAIKSATRWRNMGAPTFNSGSVNSFKIRAIGVDSLFFDVLDYGVLKGDPHKIFSQYRNAMLSESCARKIFGTDDPIGRTLITNERIYTIGGIFRDIPSNSHLCGIEMLVRVGFSDYWDGGDSYYTYFQCEDGTSLDDMVAQINTLFAPRYEQAAKEGWGLSFEARNVTEWDNGNNTAIVNLILFILGIALIVMSGLNFALLEINSLVSRTKEVGVHKASGANSRGVFMLIIWETVLYLLLALLCSAILLWGAQPQIESFAGYYEDIFHPQYLWALGLSLLVLLLLAGVMPAVLYARVPVTQVFQRLSSAKLRWKQVLLFIQFVTAIFIICITIILTRQYNALTTYDLGYDYKQLYTIALDGTNEVQRQTIKNELLNISGVEAVTISEQTPNIGLSGSSVTSDNETVCSARTIGIDSDFFSTYGIPIMQGEILITSDSIDENRVVMVNQQLLRVANTNFADAKLNMEGVTRIGGVCRDFSVGSLYEEQQPVVIYKRNENLTYAYFTVRVEDPENQEVINLIEAKIKALAPNNQDDLWSFEQIIADKYSTERMIRDGVLVAAAILFVIAILGIIGYVSTEVARRRGEIAVRRVHGAGALSVVLLVANRLLIVALIAAAVAIPCAYILGEMLLGFFAVQTTLAWWVFALGSGIVIMTLLLCVMIQTYHIATSNPSLSIKSE